MVIPERLYRAYSFVDNHPDLGNVCFAWFYHLRGKPIAPYKDLIEGYADLDEAKKTRAQRQVDELFTGEEAEVLTAYLEKEHGMDSFLIERFVPIRLEDMDHSKILRSKNCTPGAIYMFSQEPGYSLPFEVWAYYQLRESEKPDESQLSYVIEKGEKRIEWLAKQIFTAFPRLVTGLKFHILDCECIYYQRKLFDGTLVSKTGIYRDAADGPCQACMAMDGSWKDRVLHETVVYNCGFQVE